MKIHLSHFFVSAVLAAISNVATSNVIYSPQTGNLNISAIEVNGKIEFINVVLQLQSDGFFHIVSADKPPLIPDGSGISFPTTDRIDFNYQQVGGIFRLSNGSMWVVKGYSGSSGSSTGSGIKNTSIYKGTSALSSPPVGVKTDYFMLIEGSAITFFIQNITNHSIHSIDKIDFNYQQVGGIFRLSNGSMWVVKGYSGSSGNSTGSGIKNTSIYKGTSALSSPPVGVKTDYFMLIEGSAITFFVTPM